MTRAVAAGWKYGAVVVFGEAVTSPKTAALVESFCVRGVQAKTFTDLWTPFQWLDSANG